METKECRHYRRETKRFRIMAETPARPDEIKKAEVVVERIRAKGRWD